MGWLIAALGTGLAIGGTIAIYFGAPYIQLEWGYSEVIAGTTALSAGILAIALAGILFALRDLKRLVAVRSSAAHADERPGASAVARKDPPVSPAAVPVSTPIEPGPDRADASPLTREPALVGLTRESIASGIPSADEAPTVVGRYEANGASYVLFSDGTIEVETETGTHRYASMQDLRDHIARQEAG